MNKKYLGLALLVTSVGLAIASTTASIFPTGDGAYTAWTPSTGSTHYTLVDESSCNGLTDYVSTTVNGNRDAYSVSLASVPDGATITNIAITPCASRNTNKTSVMKVFYRLNGANSADSGSYSLTGTTPVALSATNFSSLSITKNASTSLQIGAVLTSGTGGARLSNISTVITYTVNYNITSSASGYGTVSPLGVTAVPQGLNQTYTITPNPGHYIASLTVDGTSTAATSSYTFFNVQAPHTISATFGTTTYNIVSSAGVNGSISPLGTTTVEYGTNQTYTITPDAGYYVYSLYVDGSYAGTSTSYTFSNVQAPHTIVAYFNAYLPGTPYVWSLVGTTTPASILVNWYGAQGGTPTGFSIERSTDGVNFAVATTTPYVFSYSDFDVASGNTYYYKMRAFNGYGYSSYSNVASSTLP
jgi:hypothetical protein